MSNILTRIQYEFLIDTYQAEEKNLLLSRFDGGNGVYGGPPDLDSRDWIKEAREEGIDQTAYRLWERERLRRLSLKK